MSLRFAGYAALFDRPDGGRDTIRPGAFAASLRNQAEALPLCWQHRFAVPIGRIERAVEDRRGLQVIGRIDRAQSRAAHLLRSGSLSGLSVGYRARHFRTGPQGRELLEIELLEISLVADPMQHGARVHLVTG